MREQLTQRQAEYLERLFVVSGGGERSVHLKDVAKLFCVKPPSALSVLENLESLGFLEKVGRGEWRLTGAGVETGRTLNRRFEVMERFCRKVLLMDPASSYRGAVSVFSALADEVAKSMSRLMEVVERMGAERWRTLVEGGGTTLLECGVGEVEVVEFGNDPVLRRRLRLLGVQEGKKCLVKELKVEGAVLSVDGEEVFLTEEEARKIKVKKVEEGDGNDETVL